MGIHAQLKDAYLEQTAASIFNTPCWSTSETKSVTFVLKSLATFPTKPVGNHYVSEEEVPLLNDSQEHFILRYYNQSLKRMSLEGSTIIGRYQIVFNGSSKTDQDIYNPTMTVTVDKALAPLLPTSQEQADELALCVLCYPKVWFHQVGFNVQVEKATRNIRRVLKSMAAVSCVGLVTLCVLLANGSLSAY